METFAFAEKLVHRDQKLSTELLTAFPGLVKPHDCFSNVYRLITQALLLCRRQLKVAYGYLRADADLYCAHAFFLDSEHGAVDPTRSLQAPVADDEYVVAIVMDLPEFLACAVEAKNTDLRGSAVVRKAMRQCAQEAFQKNIYCVG